MDVLYGCSKTWKLAEKSYNLITEKLKHLYEAGELKDVFEFIIENHLHRRPIQVEMD